jgi:hypothetical protein
MIEPRVLRSDRRFRETYIRLSIPGFERDTDVSLRAIWYYDGSPRQPDPRKGRYPWVEVDWVSGHSLPDDRKLSAMSYVFSQATLIEQYIHSGLIRQQVVDIQPFGQTRVGKPIEHWRVLRLDDEGNPVALPGFGDVDYATAAQMVIKLNNEAGVNVGLKRLGGLTEYEANWATYVDQKATDLLALHGA